MMNDSEPTNVKEDSYPVSARARNSGWTREEGARQSLFLDLLQERFSISIEYIVLNCVVSLILIAGFLLDQLPLFLLAALLAPLIIPVYSLAFGISLGSGRFILAGTWALLLSGLITFLAGLFAGLVAGQLNMPATTLWTYFINYSWANFLLIVIGLLFAMTVLLRNPKQGTNVANAALSFTFYLPLAAAGFTMIRGETASALSAFLAFGVQFLFAIALGVIVLMISGVRRSGMKLIAPVLVVISAAVGIFFIFSNPGRGPGREQSNLPLPTATMSTGQTQTPLNLATAPGTQPTTVNTPLLAVQNTPAAMPTATLALPTIPPTITPTVTLTSLPTPVWAEIMAAESNGVNVRAEPGFNARIITTILNGTLVQVLPDTQVIENNTWVRIRLQDQTEGWVVRSLLVSSTPAADW